MKPRSKKEMRAYRGHAIERLEMDSAPLEIPEEHGTSATYECGVSILEDKEASRPISR